MVYMCTVTTIFILYFCWSYRLLLHFFFISDIFRTYNNKFGAICLNAQPCAFSNNLFYSNIALNRIYPKLEFYNPQIRQISYTPSLLSDKPSSKVEETVNAVKEKAQKEAEGKEIVVAKPKKTIKQKIIDEVKHYYHGFRLLGLNAKISFKLALKKMKGVELTRREHNLVSLKKYILNINLQINLATKYIIYLYLESRL